MAVQYTIDLVLALFGKTGGLESDIETMMGAIPDWLKELLRTGMMSVAIVIDFLFGEQPTLPDWLSNLTSGDVGEGVGSTLDNLWASITSFFTGKQDEAAQAVAQGITDPIIAGFEDVEDEAVGHSIFPDMFDSIVQLFNDLPDEITPGMQGFVRVIRVQGRNASRWFTYMVKSMRTQLHALIKSLYSAINALQTYASAVRSSGFTSGATTSGATASYQTGGIIQKMETALLHPGELVLNVAQQKNLALALQGSTPSGVSAEGAGATVVTVEQSNWQFAGSLSEGEREELRRVAKEGAFEGIAEVFAGAT